MGQITLVRTRLQPLTFDGEEVKSAGGPISDGKEYDRWHELRLFRTNCDEWVLSISYRSLSDGEVNHDKVTFALDMTDLAEELQDYDPLQFAVRVPPDGRKDVLRSLQLRYSAAIRDLCATLPFSPCGRQSGPA